MRADAGLGDRPAVQSGRAGTGSVVAEHTAADDVTATAFDGVHHQLVGITWDDVVGVHERHELGARSIESDVARPPQAPVLDVQDPPPGTPLRELVGNLPRSVGGSVVHEQDLEVAEGLVGQGLQARHEVVLDVVDRDHHTQPRTGRGCWVVSHSRSVFQSESRLRESWRVAATAPRPARTDHGVSLPSRRSRGPRCRHPGPNRDDP